MSVPIIFALCSALALMAIALEYFVKDRNFYRGMYRQASNYRKQIHDAIYPLPDQTGRTQ